MYSYISILVVVIVVGVVYKYNILLLCSQLNSFNLCLYPLDYLSRNPIHAVVYFIACCLVRLSEFVRVDVDVGRRRRLTHSRFMNCCILQSIVCFR